MRARELNRTNKDFLKCVNYESTDVTLSRREDILSTKMLFPTPITSISRITWTFHNSDQHW